MTITDQSQSIATVAMKQVIYSNKAWLLLCSKLNTKCTRTPVAMEQLHTDTPVAMEQLYTDTPVAMEQVHIF